MAPRIHIEVAIYRAFSVLLWRNDSGGASSVQFGPDPIDVESLVSKQSLEGDILDQRRNADAVMALAWQKHEARQIAKRIDKGDDLRGQASPRPANGLMASPPFAPVPCLWTRTIVPSMRAYSKSGSPDKPLKILSKMPFLAHRRKRRNTVFQHPKIPGKSRQGAPVRTIHKTASRKRRLSAAVRPGSPGFPGKFGAIRSYCSSLNSIRSKADPHFFSLESLFATKENPSRKLNVHRP